MSASLDIGLLWFSLLVKPTSCQSIWVHSETFTRHEIVNTTLALRSILPSSLTILHFRLNNGTIGRVKDRFFILFLRWNFVFFIVNCFTKLFNVIRDFDWPLRYWFSLLWSFPWLIFGFGLMWLFQSGIRESNLSNTNIIIRMITSSNFTFWSISLTQSRVSCTLLASTTLAICCNIFEKLSSGVLTWIET